MYVFYPVSAQEVFRGALGLIKSPDEMLISLNLQSIKQGSYGLYPPKLALNNTFNTDQLPLIALIFVGTSPLG